MDTESGAQEDQMAEMLLFMEKLPPEFVTGDLSMMDFSGDNLQGVSTSPPPPPPPTIQNPNPFPPLFPYGNGVGDERRSSMAAMRETIFRIAAMQPVHIDPESVKPPRRRNVKISRDPQSVAARHRRERISQRIRILQRLVPGGTKMDTASMLDEAIHYVKFLKTQVQSLERAAVNRPPPPEHGGVLGFPVVLSAGAMKGCPVMHTTTRQSSWWV